MSSSELDHRIKAEYFERIQAFAAKVPDYEAGVTAEGVRDIEISPRVVRFIERTPHGPEIGYYFAKNPEELVKTQKLSPHRMMEELWRLDSKVTKERQLNAWNPWLYIAAISGDSV